MLNNRKILLGVSGGIAAYKSVELVRRLRERRAEVRVVMTGGAQAFVTPLSFQAVSGNRVHTRLLDEAAEAAMGHIELARWADLLVLAPATADILAKLAAGLADDLLSTLCLASSAPIFAAPAMNQAMWRHPATRRNCATLRQRGVVFIGPESGDQACGDIGPGRMTEPEQLVEALAEADRRHTEPGVLRGKRVVITAGPTREALDPVRFIGNHSSGKQGYALAEAALAAGAEVTLISGPVALEAPARACRINVTSAEEMCSAALAEARQCDVFIGVAAVADYRPENPATAKLKRDASGKGLTVKLVQNPDIIASVAALQDAPFTVGFAAETDQLAAHAREKLRRKRLQMIVANDVADPRIGFGSDENEALVLWPDGECRVQRCGKQQLAARLVELIAGRLARTAERAS